mmetsp:Transcript_16344/g.46659  ORF Transcript_16344/g.46659 Transcript_16344/m.46659 type:complete len:212 (-) Transcript_16344:630-1265(-)
MPLRQPPQSDRTVTLRGRGAKVGCCGEGGRPHVATHPAVRREAEGRLIDARPHHTGPREGEGLRRRDLHHALHVPREVLQGAGTPRAGGHDLRCDARQVWVRLPLQTCHGQESFKVRARRLRDPALGLPVQRVGQDSHHTGDQGDHQRRDCAAGGEAEDRGAPQAAGPAGRGAHDHGLPQHPEHQPGQPRTGDTSWPDLWQVEIMGRKGSS